MAKTYNLADIISAADAAEDSNSGDFLRSSLVEGGTLDNGTWPAVIKKVKVTEENYFGMPCWGLVVEFTDGPYKGKAMWMDQEFTSFDFLNKRVLRNFRELGVSDSLLNGGELDVIAAVLEGKLGELTVNYSVNPKNDKFPRENHQWKLPERHIPAPIEDEDDDDY